MKKSNKFINFISSLIYVLFGVILFLICAVILNSGLSFSSVGVLVVLVIIAFFIFKKRKKIFKFLKSHKKGLKITCIVLIIFSVILRLAFLFIGDRIHFGSTLLDSGVHWYGAQQIVDTGVLNQEIGEYEATFPYLTPYTITLGLFMFIFGKGVASVIVSNIVFDSISCITLYFLFSDWGKDKNKGLFVATLWAINPLEIIFCSMSLAIVMVNMFIILSIALFYFCLKIRKKLAFSSLLALVTGAILAVGNAFRPIFIVFLIAMILYSVFIIIEDRRNLSFSLLGIACMCLAYFCVGSVTSFIYPKVNPFYHGEKSNAGWSIYVGANYETKGRWNSSDRDYFFGTVLREQAVEDIGKAQSLILEQGINRYKEITKNGQLGSHLVNKIGVLFGDVKNSIYNLWQTYSISRDGIFYKFLQNMVLVYYYCLIGVCSYYFVRKRRDLAKKLGFRLFLMVLFIGLLLASLLVEVMNRYSLPFIAILFILAFSLIIPNRKTLKM